MMHSSYYKLDNPAWYALSETHAGFTIGSDKAKRYQRDIVAFAALRVPGENELSLLDPFIASGESFFIIGDLPQPGSGYIIESVLPCVQMVCTKEIKSSNDAVIEKLDEKDDEQIVSLINLVQPGYYKPGTRAMGDYFGIFEKEQLVSITGERIRMNGFTEISAVVTHPYFGGRKYAQQLVADVANKNFKAGIIPFLHVAETNKRAIGIYEYLGFMKRRTINFTKITRSSPSNP